MSQHSNLVTDSLDAHSVCAVLLGAGLADYASERRGRGAEGASAEGQWRRGAQDGERRAKGMAFRGATVPGPANPVAPRPANAGRESEMLAMMGDHEDSLLMAVLTAAWLIIVRLHTARVCKSVLRMVAHLCSRYYVCLLVSLLCMVALYG